MNFRKTCLNGYKMKNEQKKVLRIRKKRDASLLPKFSAQIEGKEPNS